MNTYRDNGFEYFYDTSLRLWTLYKVDDNGNQIGDAYYYNDQNQLFNHHPELNFTKNNNYDT